MSFARNDESPDPSDGALSVRHTSSIWKSGAWVNREGSWSWNGGQGERNIPWKIIPNGGLIVICRVRKQQITVNKSKMVMFFGGVQILILGGSSQFVPPRNLT